ncbi:hypothetical protein R5R35_001627 [Gryllus longicercus]|uniref:C-type lectin domain-containing protein n=1 Tax=Gryllus longicercus TaxID=2509291 RepID=A0AAN9Z7S6_9ORTH
MPFTPALSSLYRLHTRALPWEEAAAACRRDGAHLLVVNSEAEALVVKEFFSRKPQLENAFNAFWLAVGFRRFMGRNETVLGGSLETSGYNKWAPFDGQWVLTPITDCGVVDRRLLYALEDCKHARGFICELEI